MVMSRSWLLWPSLLLLACASPPPGATTGDLAVSEEEQTPLKKAEALFANKDYRGTRAALAEFLEGEPEHVQARYLLARTLGVLGEIRGAKAQVQKALALRPKHALAWDLLANIHERLGEHRLAIKAYGKVAELAESRAPLRGMARCYLILGEPQNALVVLQTARARGQQRDYMTELLAFRALRWLKQREETELAARSFLELADRSKQAGLSTYTREVRDWLAANRSTLDGTTRRLMIDYVRAACRLRLPNADPPEQAVLKRAPPRMFAADRRPVFVTLYARGMRFSGMGRGKRLAAALKGAVEALQEARGFTPLKVLKAAVRIDIGRDLKRVKLEERDGKYELEGGFQAGHHGLALRTDGKEAYCLPDAPLTLDLPDLKACLEHATTSAGLGASAWQSASSSLFRFETEAFLSLAPGSAPRSLVGSEPQPAPATNLAALRQAAHRGARFLTRALRPDGSIPRGYSAPRDRFDALGADANRVLLCAPADAARVARAFAALRRISRKRRKVLAAATRHVAERLLKRLKSLPPGSTFATQAWLLMALDDLGGKAYTSVRKQLAEALLSAPPAQRIPASLALLHHAARTKDAAWRQKALALLGDPARLGLKTPLEALVLTAVAEGSARGTSRTRVLAWARQRLSATAPRTDPGFDELYVIARVARLAQRLHSPDAARLRALVLARSKALLALQLDARHRFLCKEPDRALGGYRTTLGSSHLATVHTAQAMLALTGVLDLLSR